MPTLYLSPSTQEFNPTAIGNSEEYYMNLIADAMIPYLRSNGITTIRNTPQMTAASSITQSNRNNVDLHLAIHSNAAPESLAGQLTGTDAYYDPSDSESRRFADLIVKNLKTIYYQPEKVVAMATDFLGEVLRTNAPAVLVEVAYHDNLRDVNWINDNIQPIAKELTKSVTEFFGLPFAEQMVTQKGTVNIDSGSLNIRSKPNTNAPVIIRAPKGAELFVLGMVPNWYVVDYKGALGYASQQFINV